ncbi:hypothetical protein [Nonomuraea sp. NPDC046570]|uniref:hypothetical protein n=1 Tax=Nonomuraea sp. NPDC046570 TaxID=3155255 RepID=UPI0033C3EC7E
MLSSHAIGEELLTRSYAARALDVPATSEALAHLLPAPGGQARFLNPGLPTAAPGR